MVVNVVSIVGSVASEEECGSVAVVVTLMVTWWCFDTDGDTVVSGVVGAAVGSEVVSDTDGDAVRRIQMVGDTDGDTVGSKVIGDTDSDRVWLARRWGRR